MIDHIYLYVFICNFACWRLYYTFVKIGAFSKFLQTTELILRFVFILLYAFQLIHVFRI